MIKLEPNLWLRLDQFLENDPERKLLVEFSPTGWSNHNDTRKFRVSLSKPVGCQTGALGETLEQALECILGDRL